MDAAQKEASLVPQLLVEQLYLGALDPAQAEQVRARLMAEKGGDARLNALADDDAAFLEAHPPRRVMAAIRQQAERQSQQKTVIGKKGFSAVWLGIGLAIAAALLAVFFLPSDGPKTDAPNQWMAQHITPESNDGTRLKGLTPRLVVLRERAGNAEELAPGATAQEADLLQIAYIAAGAPHGVVLSIDGRGTVTLHSPMDGEETTALIPTGRVALTHAYELDDAPEFERFFLVSSASPVNVAAIMEAAEALAQDSNRAREGRLVLPESMHQTSFLLRKQR